MTKAASKILFIGDLNAYARSYQRYRAFRSLGYEVKGISFTPDGWIPSKSGGPDLVYRLMNKIGFSPDKTGVNQKIIRSVANFSPELVWIEKGLMIKPKTLKRCKEIKPNMDLILWAEEYVFPRHNRSFYYTRCIPLYDAVVTPRSQNLKKKGLPAFGAGKILLVDETYHKNTHRPLPLNEEQKRRFGAEVSFIGSFEDDRAMKMLYLAKNGISVRIWGNGWQKWVNKHDNLYVANEPIYGNDYARAICASKICLGFLRKTNEDLQTNRTMEIPACGTFMLAERTSEHVMLFEEGSEAEFFDSKEELLEKCQYYLEHEEEREEIAKAGYKRCVKGGHSHQERLKSIIAKVKEGWTGVEYIGKRTKT